MMMRIVPTVIDTSGEREQQRRCDDEEADRQAIDASRT